MKRTRVLLTLAAGMFALSQLGSSTAAGAPLTSMCLDSTFAAGNLIEHVADITSGSDSDAVIQRSAFQLPSAPMSDIALVRSDSVCALAATAFRQAMTTNPSAVDMPVWMIKIGPTRFLVSNTQFMIGEFEAAVVFDSAFVYLATMAG